MIAESHMTFTLIVDAAMGNKNNPHPPVLLDESESHQVHKAPSHGPQHSRIEIPGAIDLFRQLGHLP